MTTFTPQNFIRKAQRYLLLSLLITGISACGSDDSDDSKQGYVKFFNATKNAPAIHLTLDEDLETSEDDEVEVTFNAINYGEALSRSAFDAQSYYYELAWQDGDSSERSELAMLHQGQLTVADDTLHLIVMTEDVTAPNVQVYDIAIIEDDDDDLYERFNLSVLNSHSPEVAVDVYLSKSDESFNEAVLLGSYGYQQLSENHKFDQGSYVFYLTEAGSDQVLFESKTIDYFYASQYVMMIRENTGAGASPFILEKLSNASQTTYIDFNAEAQFNVYNAIAEHELIPEYSGNISVSVSAPDHSESLDSLAYGQISEVLRVDNGDYSVDVLASEQATPLLSNHLLSLPENTKRTLILYADVTDVDDDQDGDVDENGDGIVDEQEVVIHSLVVENNSSDSIYNHEITLVNIVDNDDFSLVNFYFVRSDETISTALYKKALGFSDQGSINLNNNSYQVYVVAKDQSSDIVLTSFTLVLDENSKDQVLVIENSAASATGYKASLFEQIIKE